MKVGLSVFRSACVTTMDTTLGFIRDNVVLSTLFLPIVTSLFVTNPRTCGPYTVHVIFAR
jgi:hypothetical protein